MNCFTALADPTRANIVSMLAVAGRMPVSAINKNFKMSAPAISQHLKILRNANLVNVEISAQQRFYSLNITGLCEIEDWTKGIRNSWEELNDRLFEFLESQRGKDE